MEWWQYLLIGVGALVVLLLAVIIIRTLAFKPIKENYKNCDDIDFDKDKAVDDLVAMIKCKTVSSRKKEEESEDEFIKFEEVLKTRFPEIVKNSTFKKVGARALLFKIEGENHDAPAVFMAHYDVVSVVESEWTKPAFDGVIEDDVMWGRGTLDTKITLNAVMQATETLLKSGKKFKNDIYLAFAGDEEIAGTGATMIVDILANEGITPAFVLDEGGAVVEKVFPGVKEPCALIGIAEKGMLDLEFSIKGAGGHASSPPPHTAVGRLSKACVKMEDNPAKFNLSMPAAKMFDTLGRRSSFLLRMVFANLWLFKPVLNALGKSKGGEMNALMRTTCAFTQMQGSKGSNVLPPEAKMVANFRLVPGETVEGTVERVRKTIADDSIELSVTYGMNPSRVSTTDCEGYNIISSAIASTWKGSIVSPYLMVACSDSRHYGRISDRVYRFSAMALSTYERSLIHSNDERVPLDTIYKSVEFYLKVLQNC